MTGEEIGLVTEQFSVESAIEGCDGGGFDGLEPSDPMAGLALERAGLAGVGGRALPQ